MSQKRHPVGALGHNMPESAIMWGERPVSQVENLQIDLQASHATFVRRKPILRRCDLRVRFSSGASCRILQLTSTSSPATSILSLSKDAVPGQKWPFSRPVTLRQALHKHPERSGGQRDYALGIHPQNEAHP